MKKLALTAILAVLSTSIFASPVAAEPRIELKVSRQTVVTGSGTAISIQSRSVGESNSYSWSRFKFQLALDKGISSGIRAVIFQGSAGKCNGSLLTSDSNLRQCLEFVNNDRMIFSAGAAEDYINRTQLVLTSLIDRNFAGSVRAWLDLDNDDITDPYEPRSDLVDINFISTKEFQSFVDFSPEPILTNAKQSVAWFSQASGFEAVGQGLENIIDTSLVRAIAYACDPIGRCRSESSTGTFNNHPQISATKFEFPNISAGDKTVEYTLRYEPLSDVGFDLKKVTVTNGHDDLGQIKTLMTGTDVQSYSGQDSPDPLFAERWHQIPVTRTLANYSATFLDKTGKPIVGREVDIRIDAHLLRTSVNLRIDGLRLTPAHRDQFWIKRKTNASGQITLRLENSLPYAWDSLAIEPVMQGIRPWEQSMGGKTERLVWQRSSASKLSIGGTFNSSTGELSVVALVSSLTGTEFKPELVQFSTSGPLQVSQSVLRTFASRRESNGTWTGQAVNTVRISNAAEGVGTANVTATVRAGGKTFTAVLPVSWNASSRTLSTKQTGIDSGYETQVSSLGGQIRIRSLNAAELQISAQVSGKWYSWTPTTNDFQKAIPANKGQQVTVSVYIEGVLVQVTTLTVR